MPDDRLMTTSEIADLIGVNRSTVHRWVLAGRLSPAVTIGKLRLFTEDEVNRFRRERAR